MCLQEIKKILRAWGSMEDAALRLMREFAKLMSAMAEDQRKLQASVVALQGMVMDVKGMPPSSYKEIRAMLEPLEAQVLTLLPPTPGLEQVRALIDFLESGHDPKKPYS